jgi:Ricin-type beta-trefoil lectin domain-like
LASSTHTAAPAPQNGNESVDAVAEHEPLAISRLAGARPIFYLTNLIHQGLDDMKMNAITIFSLALTLTLFSCGPSDENDQGGGHDEATAQAKLALAVAPSYWVNGTSLVCLDSDPYGNVYTIKCNGGPYQMWRNVPASGDPRLDIPDNIVNVATGRCLDSNAAGAVYTLPCNGGEWQKWRVRAFAGAFVIRNVQTGYFLARAGFGAAVGTDDYYNTYSAGWY